MDDTLLETALQTGVGNGTIQLEARTYALTRPITVTGGPLVVRGHPGATKLLWNSASPGGLVISTGGDHRVPIYLSDLSLLIDGPSASTALTVDYSGTTFPTTPEPWGHFERLTIKGSVDPFQSYWGSGINIINGNRICMRDMAIEGGIGGTEPNYATQSGILFGRTRPSSGIYLDHIEVMHCIDGLGIIDYEGIVVTRSAFVGVQNGIAVRHTNSYPHISISDTHVNSFGSCIVIVNGQEAIITNNDLHLRSVNRFGAAVRITGNGHKSGLIKGNAMVNYGDKTLAPIGVVLDNAQSCLIEGNTIAEFAIGVWLPDGATNCALASGTFRGCSNAFVNTNNSNNINAPAITVVLPIVP